MVEISYLCYMKIHQQAGIAFSFISLHFSPFNLISDEVK